MESQRLKCVRKRRKRKKLRWKEMSFESRMEREVRVHEWMEEGIFRHLRQHRRRELWPFTGVEMQWTKGWKFQGYAFYKNPAMLKPSGYYCPTCATRHCCVCAHGQIDVSFQVTLNKNGRLNGDYYCTCYSNHSLTKYIRYSVLLHVDTRMVSL